MTGDDNFALWPPTATEPQATYVQFPGCECPTAWWGLTPPPCPLHNPPSGTWTYRLVGPEPPPAKPEAQKGWECPRCSRINAPHTPFCCKDPGR